MRSPGGCSYSVQDSTCSSINHGGMSQFIPKPSRENRREEKSDLEMEYEARLREMDEKHQHELQELENAYQQKIMGEVERYQVIDASREIHNQTCHSPDCMTFVLSRFTPRRSNLYICRLYHSLRARRLLCKKETCNRIDGTSSSSFS